MKYILAFLIGGMLLVMALAMTGCSKVKTNQIRISYIYPEKPEHQQVYTLLKERQSLEKLQEFFSPFRLEWILTITLDECDGEADAMYSDDTITICYEYIAEMHKLMPASTTPAGIEPIDTLLGPFVDTVIHEFAHALFDYADVPVLGREEDAADQVSAYIYLQFKDNEARRLIMGAVYSYLMEAKLSGTPSMADFAAEHSTPQQRAFNLTCMAYGKDSELFNDLPLLAGLTEERAEFCEEEFELISLAYEDLIQPHIDLDLAEKVYARNWLPEEASQMLSNPR